MKGDRTMAKKGNFVTENRKSSPRSGNARVRAAASSTPKLNRFIVGDAVSVLEKWGGVGLY